MLASSLRRHDPDQVMRVERHTLLSARKTDSPFGCQKSVYDDGYLLSSAMRPGLKKPGQTVVLSALV